MERSEVFELFSVEREYQDRKWGGPEHDRQNVSWTWLFYLMKFMGKATAALMNGDQSEAKRQFVKVGALVVAALEHAPDLQSSAPAVRELPELRVQGPGGVSVDLVREGQASVLLQVHAPGQEAQFFVWTQTPWWSLNEEVLVHLPGKHQFRQWWARKVDPPAADLAGDAAAGAPQ